jgi:hypothetical protein
MTRCHYGREPIAPVDARPVPGVVGARACLAHLLLKSINRTPRAPRETYIVATSDEAARMRSLSGIAVIRPYPAESGTYWIADAWRDGRAVYSYVGAISQREAIEHAREYLKGMR